MQTATRLLINWSHVISSPGFLYYFGDFLPNTCTQLNELETLQYPDLKKGNKSKSLWQNFFSGFTSFLPTIKYMWISSSTNPRGEALKV